MDKITIIFAAIAGAILLAALGLLIAAIAFIVRRENKNELRAEPDPTQKKDAPSTEMQSDAMKMWLQKRKENTQYYSLIVKQVKYTFALALGSAVFGLIMFAVAVCTALMFNTNLVVALIPAISAAVVEVFTGIFLALHRSAIKQISRFSEISNQEERFYSAVMLAQTLSQQAKDAVVTELLRTELGPINSPPAEANK